MITKKLLMISGIFFINQILILNSLAQSNLEVSGIMMGDKPVAVVNGEMVKKGDKIGDYEVIKIEEDFVEFKIQNQVIKQQLKKIENNPPVKEKLNLFKGVQVNDISKINTFELKDDDNCSITITSPTEVNSVFAKFFKRGNLVSWALLNKENVPLQLNYFLDEYYIVDKQGKVFKFPIADISEYPDYINPEQIWTYLNLHEDADSFQRRYVNFDEIAFIYAVIDNKKRLILLKPCPSPN